MICRELRAKDLERLHAVVEELKAKEKRGLTKDQKEELATAEKIRDFVEAGTDVRCCTRSRLLLSLSTYISVRLQGVSAKRRHQQSVCWHCGWRQTQSAWAGSSTGCELCTGMQSG